MARGGFMPPRNGTFVSFRYDVFCEHGQKLILKVT